MALATARCGCNPRAAPDAKSSQMFIYRRCLLEPRTAQTCSNSTANGPWNEADRERYNIVRERYTSDLSDDEYALIEPLLPQPKRRGRKPTPARTILNAIFY